MLNCSGVLHILVVVALLLQPQCCYATTIFSQLATAVSDMTSFKCQMTLSTTVYEDGRDEQQVACIFRKDFIWPINNFPTDLYETYVADITRGTLWMRISAANVLNSRLVISKGSTFEVLSTALPDVTPSLVATPGMPLTLPSRARGNQTLFILRISTIDSAPTYTLPQLKRHIVGRGPNDDSRPSLRQQFKACSFGQLNFVYKGGKTVRVNAPVASFASAAVLVDMALVKIAKLKGLSSASELADKVMVIVPPGTAGGWLSNAALNYWRSTYNDKWGFSLSSNLHEMGHNLGLLHSGEGVNGTDLSYGDKTGYMGYGQISSTYPLKCFDGFKNWQLGWYASNQLRITDYSSPRRLTLVSFVDFDTAGSQPVLINLSDYLFLQFNRAKSFNRDTEEKQNLLTITRNDPSRSQSVAGLGAGQRYKVRNWQNSQQPLVIEVCSISFNDDVPEQTDKLVVSIALGRSYCSRRIK